MSQSDNNKELPLIPFADLKGKAFVIPYQQRGYKWTSSNVEELLCDLREFIHSGEKKKVYCLQPIAIVPNGDNTYTVLDGQQRLTTLYLLYVYLSGQAPYRFIYERDKDSGKDMSRRVFLENIATVEKSIIDSSRDFYYIHNAYAHICRVFTEWTKQSCRDDAPEQLLKESLERHKKQFLKLLKETKNDSKSIRLIWYEVKKDRQYEVFRNLNSGKIPLTNSDLIKALFLNEVSELPLGERVKTASMFEQMEEQMKNDHFWYMCCADELRNGQTRMDFIFNIVAGCKKSDYDIDPRWSFRNYFSKTDNGSLSEKWKQVRHTYLRLKDLYEDIYCYHYIGFLTYNSKENTLNSAQRLLKLSRDTTHSEFRDKLKKDIKQILTRNHHCVQDYNFEESSKKDLRLLFLLHNVETILQKYESLHNSAKLRLDFGFERFPFELLHRQDWDIEHIASNTDSDFRNPEDRESWLNSIKADLGDKYPLEDVLEKENSYTRTKSKEAFNSLYKAIMTHCDKEIGGDAIKDTDETREGKNKMQIGNLTLLDSHTNRSYHNALFPRKRRYIIVANGLTARTDDAEAGISKSFIPPCTLSVFTKAYSKGSNLTLNAWTQPDADAYVKDIEQKLRDYFEADEKK